MPDRVRQPERLLIVDDEEAVRDAYGLILADAATTPARVLLDRMRSRLFPTASPDDGVAPGAPAPRDAAVLPAASGPSGNRPAVLFDLTFCAGAEQAVAAVNQALAEARPFALAFIDMRMAGGPDGVWAAQHIRELDPQMEIVICTAFSDMDAESIAVRVPPADKIFYLEKPLRDLEVRLIARALTQKWRAERRISRLAYFDQLTGLPNRTRFMEHLGGALEAARGGDELLAVLYVDLDNFKRINDTLGHGVGDQLLAVAAERLRLLGAQARMSLARLGGDEFVVMLPGIGAPEDACLAAERVVRELSRPMKLSAHDVQVTPSVGIALHPSDGGDVETLCRNADLAMYFAKRQGPGRFALYKETMNAGALKRLTLEAHLRGAVDRNELSLHYQPQVALGTGRVAGFEALMRWTSAELGCVSPADFIPVAEETGLIVAIGEWALRTCCLQIKAWHDEGFHVGRVAVNVSALQFAQQDFDSLVESVLRETGLAPGFLELEVTESLVMRDEAHAERTFAALKKLGVSLAVDDFGTGYSNFRRLRQLAVDRLKIDRSFVNGIIKNPEDRALVTGMIKLAQTMGLAVVAEGVEDFSQLLHLQEERCDEAQGYLLGRPLPVAETRDFLMRLADVHDAGRTVRLRTLAQ